MRTIVMYLLKKYYHKTFVVSCRCLKLKQEHNDLFYLLRHFKKYNQNCVEKRGVKFHPE